MITKVFTILIALLNRSITNQETGLIPVKVYSVNRRKIS